MKIEGKTVTDAKHPLVLEITPGDVAKGRKRKPDCCAAAVACVRQMGATSARVFLSRVYVEYPKGWVRYTTPKSLRTEIVSFDRGHRFEAGTYKLSHIRPSVQLNAARTSPRRKTGTHPQTGNRLKNHIAAGVRERASNWTTA